MPSILKDIQIFHDASPQGSTPVDNSSNAPSILAINGFFMSFTSLVVLARLYVRTIMLRNMGVDDWVISGAMACGVAVFICFVGETKHGVGKFTDAVSTPELEEMLHWQFFHSLLVTVGICLVKISIAFFLLRLVPGKKYKIFLYCMMVFLIAFTLVSAFTIIFSCVPVQASWDLELAPTAKCFSDKIFTDIVGIPFIQSKVLQPGIVSLTLWLLSQGLFNSSINIATDIIFASLPIPMIWSLQVNKRTKATLTVILSLGWFACAAAVVKTVLQAKVFTTPNSFRNDSYFIWNSIELYVGIMAASLPSLRPIFKSILETTKSLRSRRTGLEYSGNNLSGVRGKYYIQEEIGMNSLGAPSRKSTKYDAKVTSSTPRSTASTVDDYGIKRDSDSEENILPLQGKGITRTIDITIH